MANLSWENKKKKTKKKKLANAIVFSKQIIGSFSHVIKVCGT